MGLGPTGHPGAALPFFCHNGDPLSQPPPAHMGIPPYQLDGKTGSMGEYGRGTQLSPADWRRLGPLLAATGIINQVVVVVVVVVTKNQKEKLRKKKLINLLLIYIQFN